MNRAWDSDNNDGGADPNEAVEFGSFLGSYEFSNLEAFALGQYNLFSQSSGNPTFSFSVPYYGFYVQNTFRALPKLTLEMGLREDFQVYPQPAENPAFPLTGSIRTSFCAWRHASDLPGSPSRRLWCAADSGNFIPT
ncbi:MAG: hypothetical protein WB952_22485 [Terriglobales bacterium]